MASRAISLEDEVEDGAWINYHDHPLIEYGRLSRDEQMRLLEQVRMGTVILKLDAKNTDCSFENGGIVINSVLSGMLKQKLDELVSRGYIQRYSVSRNNGTSVINLHKCPDNGYNFTKSSRTIALAFRHKLAKEAKERLMLGNQPLIISRAKIMKWKYNLSDFFLADIIQEGQFGLYRAIDQYRPERHIEFSTYATYSIDNAIKRQMRVMDKIIVVSRPMTYLVSSLEMDACENRISFTEACRERKLVPGAIKTAVRARDATKITSFSETFGEGGEFGDTLPYSGGSGKEVVEKSLMLDYVRKLVDRLSWKQRQVIVMSYFCEERSSFRKIGKSLGVSRERARQIGASAIKKLRKYAGVDK